MQKVLERLNEALADRYFVESEIGRGGMATVFLAEDLKHHRKVAIKVLHPELASAIGEGRFLNEIDIVAGLTHPHILTLIDSGDAGGLLYYVMPFVDGESLRSRLQREKQLPVDEAVQIAREVAEALTYAHESGVVHRDIKPGNILLEQGHAIVTDFGVAKALGAAGAEKLTSTGLAVGTPRYMSPEQGTGEQEPDGRTDIYALGCVLYEMLAGDPPFTGVTPQVVIKRHSQDPVPNLRTARETTPAAVQYAIEKALAKAPADRFKTAAEFSEALTAAPPRTVSGKARRHLQGAAVAVATAATVLVGLTALGLRDRSRDPAARERREIRLTEHGRVWTPAPAAVSPDGRSVAYLVTDRPRDAGMQLGGSQNLKLMLADLDGEAAPSEPRILEVLQEGWDLGWTPDGSHVQVTGVLREATGIFLLPIAGGPYRHLTTRELRPSAWAPDGSRLAVKSAYLTVGFVDGSAQGPTEIEDEFEVQAEGHQLMGLAWSPGGDRLALSTDSASISVLWTVNPDGSDLRRLRVEGPVQRIHWAPTGGAIYYSRSTPPRELVRLDLSAPGGGTSEPEVLSTECRYSSIAMSAGSAGCARIQQIDSRFWLRRLDPAGDSVLLTPEPARRSRPVLSPDGSHVLYVKDGEEGRDLHTLALEGGEERRLTFRGDAGGPAGRAAWSPDGRYIAYIGVSPDGSTSAWIVPSAGGRSVRVEDLVAGWDVQWSPGPNPMVQLESRTNWVVLEPGDGSWESALVGRTVQVRTRELVPTDRYAVWSPAISPSGGRVAVYWNRGPTAEDGSRPNTGIWILSLSDSSAELVAGRAPDSPAMFPMRWSEDGYGLYFRRATGIELLDLRTGEISPVATPADQCITPEPDADGYFLCESVRIEVDAWIIENFDPHVP